MFRTARNARWQDAIAPPGATRRGVWRNHRILRDGLYRDSVYYRCLRLNGRAFRARPWERFVKLEGLRYGDGL